MSGSQKGQEKGAKPKQSSIGAARAAFNRAVEAARVVHDRPDEAARVAHARAVKVAGRAFAALLAELEVSE